MVFFSGRSVVTSMHGHRVIPWIEQRGGAIAVFIIEVVRATRTVCKVESAETGRTRLVIRCWVLHVSRT